MLRAGRADDDDFMYLRTSSHTTLAGCVVISAIRERATRIAAAAVSALKAATILVVVVVVVVAIRRRIVCPTNKWNNRRLSGDYRPFCRRNRIVPRAAVGPGATRNGAIAQNGFSEQLLLLLLLAKKMGTQLNLLTSSNGNSSLCVYPFHFFSAANNHSARCTYTGTRERIIALARNTVVVVVVVATATAAAVGPLLVR